MFFRLRVAAVVALFQGLFVSGIEFSGPKATPVIQNADYDANGWTPKPTGGPRPVLELMRRQDEEDPSFCGYADGDPGMFFLSFVICTSQDFGVETFDFLHGFFLFSAPLPIGMRESPRLH
jgi:hypothetical protein